MKSQARKNQRSFPAGLEIVILKKLPKWLMASTLIPVMMSAFTRLLPAQSNEAAIAKQQLSIDILAIALGITGWTAIFTIAIGCTVVVIMKGPVRRADSYEMKESNYPLENKSED